MAIFGGKRVGGASLTKGLIPYSEPFTVVLNGTSWITIKDFGVSVQLEEILAKVPTLANAANVIFGLFDPDYLTDGDERWNSGNIAESATADVGLDRIMVPGSLLRIKADAAADESVTGIIYGIL